MVCQYGLRRNSHSRVERVLSVKGGGLVVAVFGHLHHLFWTSMATDQSYGSHEQAIRRVLESPTVA